MIFHAVRGSIDPEGYMPVTAGWIRIDNQPEPKEAYA